MADVIDRLNYLSDNETKIDLLNNEAIAKTVIRLVRNRSDKPITIGVHGDWGAGKSSVLEMVDGELQRDERTICLKFNGWQFQGFEDAKIALIEGVVGGLIEKRSLFAKAEELVRQTWANIDLLKATKGVGKLAVMLTTGIPLAGSGIADIVGGLVGNARAVATDSDKRSDAIGDFEGVLKADAKFGKPGMPERIAEFRKLFAKLIKAADVDRLVVLVDDLDRCLPETMIETLEAIRLFVLLEKTAFIVGADERMIEFAVQRHFPDLPQTDEAQGYARAYLEKLLQVPLRIPALGETETRVYVTLLLLGAALEESDKVTFERLLDLGRDALRRPWDGLGIDEGRIAEVLGDRLADVRPSLVTAEQVSPMLAAGTRGNPRQIKRFLNALTLRMAVADARGFGDAVEQTRLAKLMLAELFLPEAVFSYIATSAANSPDGRCHALAAFEAQDGRSGPDRPSEDDGPSGPDATPSDAMAAVLADWSVRPEVIRWSRIVPNLGDVSLKPYLFVVKDRKNFLTASAPLSPAQAAILAKLLAGPAVAASVVKELQTMPPTDIDPILMTLRSQALSSTSFDSKPPALSGIEIMVKGVPALQGRLMDVLESLPAARLGYWAATGYAQLVKDSPFKERLETLRTRWRTTGGPLLQKALDSSARLPSRQNRKQS